MFNMWTENDLQIRYRNKCIWTLRLHYSSTRISNFCTYDIPRIPTWQSKYPKMEIHFQSCYFRSADILTAKCVLRHNIRIETKTLIWRDLLKWNLRQQTAKEISSLSRDLFRSKSPLERQPCLLVSPSLLTVTHPALAHRLWVIACILYSNITATRR